ncbi:sarcosine oxidase subunit gamma [Jannaschia pohangensis]|uniref:Sarcosine oxidase subunit gamma n=1 Tax=Jannaschia pohangensis TaxID=390807 RepID=A0A1I3H4Z7_9RHOB|nr:sarcosine oxidase subunit gamma family protein [Jannaschia pohangensis]SFI30815.1 sarcosine oxidase subunit gamma [Jannaschia pohangensis]
MSDISISRLPITGMIGLRGDLSSLGKVVKAVTGCALPDQRMCTSADGHTLLWMSRDELLLTCNAEAAEAIASDLRSRLSGVFATVANISSARQVFELKGQGVESLLANVMPVDFARLDASEVRRTRMAQVPAAIWRHDGGWRLMCFRSVADYADGLLRAARPVGA